MRKLALLILFIAATGFAGAQENIEYQKPPEEILELVDVEHAPSVLMDEEKEYMVLIYRDAYKTIEELSQEEMRLAGLRINPVTNIGSRTTYSNNIKIRNLKKGETEARQVKGLPEKPLLSNFNWSPDQSKMAFTHTTLSGVELWVLDLQSASVKKLTEANINANLGDEINWFADGSAMLVKMIPEERQALIDPEKAVPTGPTVSVNKGKTAQNRTYQDLLEDKTDEHNFEQLALADIHKVDLDGSKEPWLESAMYRSISFSPDGEYVMVSTVEKPFSYLVPYYRFPSTTNIYTKAGDKVETVLEVPLIEDLPKGFMAVRKGKRNLSWRNDKAHTLVYAVALDEGDPEKEAEYRDEVFMLEAPYSGEGKSLLKTRNRFSGITWGNDKLAIAYDYWWNNRNTKTYVFNPSDPSVEPVTLFDRNYQDRYNDPGRFVTERNDMARSVLALEGKDAFLIGDGHSEEGQFPFVDEINLKSHKTKRVYQSEYTNKLENLIEYDPNKKQLLVRIESPTEYPDYYFRDLKDNELTQLTFFENPFESLQGVYTEVITYKRDDGLELSGTLYLPVGYDTNQKEELPMILWAYPREFKDKASAAQSTANPNEFIYPWYGSPLFWLTRGYVVLDDAAFPIVGEGEEEPNDSFRKQLVANAKAAIDAVDSLGYIDRDRVAVGGHSYGAFMVANLLSHSDLFAAGIARSGAYNRTLTPFGFQSEERNYWEAPEVYYNMSPFMHADKMETPLLLIHGKADNNSGTYPMQSERYFNALKGLGATVRLVMLPKESHGYRAKESILHVLWEQDRWLEKYLKN
ncbi:MAG: prolyl oligopeptidase family serine peptidase [Bacteroidales bacterium]|nr:prolyl oligopeptidase family serine peptidase [Bacteroidales bacterium]MCF8351835.1 prolyl oligopeptidase family serine peptidase [Bacteroidales bacterium]MCF8374871.1 prolyl oligopeptidase family serine peptidase [Bacteroidales bacterium]MCF8399725.1 prolyl oligopeptidase family serine peptidase [Bacteroidales bacterium]